MSFFKKIMKWIETHQKGIRLTAVVGGAACALATPVLAAKATSSVSRKIHESGASTKEEKIKIARKDPWVWATAGTTLGSLGFGALSYGVSNRVVSKMDKTIEQLTDEIDTVTSAVTALPEKEQEKINKIVMEKEVSKKPTSESCKKLSSTSCCPIVTGFGDTLFYDTWTKTWFYSSYQKILSIINDFNEVNNSGYYKNVADWCIANGYEPNEEIHNDYWFMSQISIVKDGDHFYKMDDTGVPYGVITFTVDSKPKHLPPEESKHLPWI